MAEKTNPQHLLRAFNCPHCGVFAKQIWTCADLYLLGPSGNPLQKPVGKFENFSITLCEHCHKNTIWNKSQMIFPFQTNRDFDLTHVPKVLAEDYIEACIVLHFSPKASAALSRRCLQTLLRDQGFKDTSLDKEIQNAINSKALPSHIIENIDAIRNIGNFAAHPQKDTNSGEILPVEEGEAEWNLEVLENLFDFYYVQPEKAKQRKAEFNKKLTAAGKPNLK